MADHIVQLPAYTKTFGDHADITDGRVVEAKAKRELADLRNLLSTY